MSRWDFLNPAGASEGCLNSLSTNSQKFRSVSSPKGATVLVRSTISVCFPPFGARLGWRCAHVNRRTSSPLTLMMKMVAIRDTDPRSSRLSMASSKIKPPLPFPKPKRPRNNRGRPSKTDKARKKAATYAETSSAVPAEGRACSARSAA